MKTEDVQARRGLGPPCSYELVWNGPAGSDCVDSAQGAACGGQTAGIYTVVPSPLTEHTAFRGSTFRKNAAGPFSQLPSCCMSLGKDTHAPPQWLQMAHAVLARLDLNSASKCDGHSEQTSW